MGLCPRAALRAARGVRYDTVVMGIFLNLRGDNSFGCLSQERKIGHRPVVTKLDGVESFFLDKRTEGQSTS